MRRTGCSEQHTFKAQEEESGPEKQALTPEEQYLAKRHSMMNTFYIQMIYLCSTVLFSYHYLRDVYLHQMFIVCHIVNYSRH